MNPIAWYTVSKALLRPECVTPSVTLSLIILKQNWPTSLIFMVPHTDSNRGPTDYKSVYSIMSEYFIKYFILLFLIIFIENPCAVTCQNIPSHELWKLGGISRADAKTYSSPQHCAISSNKIGPFQSYWTHRWSVSGIAFSSNASGNAQLVIKHPCKW